MFGIKKYTKAKTKSFASDKERRRYYAIQDYYKRKARETDANTSPTKKK